MSHRRAEKDRLRAEREAAERAEQQAAGRRRKLTLGAIVFAALAAVVAIVLVASAGGSDDQGSAERKAQSEEMLSGIAQRGTSLGDTKAPLVLTEFADLQCPYCREYAMNVLPGLIERYVRTGRVRLELRLLRFVGEDSVRGARAAEAARESNRMWNFVDAFYRVQGQENTGYADDDFIKGVARTAGVDPAAALRAIDDGAYEKRLASYQNEATNAQIDSTPSFLLSFKGDKAHLLEYSELTLQAFEQALNEELAK